VNEPAFVSDWKEHLGLLLGAISTVFIAIRILSLAHFNPETAYGILQAGGTAAVIVGALLPSVGIISAAVAALCIVTAIFPWKDSHEKNRMWFMFVGIIFEIIAVATAPLALLCLIVGVVATGGTVPKVTIRNLKKRIAEIKAKMIQMQWIA
jgi:hypothetical protein